MSVKSNKAKTYKNTFTECNYLTFKKSLGSY